MTIFFYGPNGFAVRQEVERMVAAYRKKTGSDLGLERIDGGGVKARDLMANVMATPFLATSRLVVVTGVAVNKAVGPELARVMAAVPETTVAVFVEGEPDARTVAFKALSKSDKVMKFEKLAGRALMARLQREVEVMGGTVERGALEELVARAGDDQWRLREELQKLVNYDRTVTVDVVRELVTAGVEQSVFELVEAMTGGRTREAVAGYGRMLARQESPLYVLTMVQWQLRNLLWAQVAPVGMTGAELAKAAGMSPYAIGKALAAARGIDEGRIMAAYEAAAVCEMEIKTGAVSAEVGVEQLIYTITIGA